MIQELNPNSTTIKGEQYAIAWKALNNVGEDFTPEQRAHAKCWLTYRAADGEITAKDWQEKIFPIGYGDIQSPGMAVRWRYSLITAEVYMCILHADDDWKKLAEIIFNGLSGDDLTTHPGIATNVMRVMALYTYALYLDNDPSFKSVARNSIQAWRSMWINVNPEERPMRFAEVAADAVPLYVMARLLTLDKALDPWADTLVNAQASTPWGKCLIELGVHPRRLWSAKASSPAGSKVGLYKELHASQKYGTGSMSEGFKKKLLATLPPIKDGENVIDFGCGQSQDAKKLWPQAKVTRYDPAIPGIDKMPDIIHRAGLCFEVMEHIPEDEVIGILSQMNNLAQIWAITVHTGPAAQRLATGENAHCTQRPVEWWMGKFREVFVGKELRCTPINDQRFLLIIT
jgi:hypothetical protein